jgi:predicted nucleic acid-binding protein
VSRVFFDAMMFAYVLGDNKEFAGQVHQTLERCYVRGDTLLTSCLAVGEVMVGGEGDRDGAHKAQAIVRAMGFTLVPFDEMCMEVFASLRAEMRLKAPDAIHLACAAAARTDIFLTNDKQLLQRKLHVPGIQFIAHFGMGVL